MCISLSPVLTVGCFKSKLSVKQFRISRSVFMLIVKSLDRPGQTDMDSFVIKCLKLKETADEGSGQTTAKSGVWHTAVSKAPK